MITSLLDSEKLAAYACSEKRTARWKHVIALLVCAALSGLGYIVYHALAR